MKPPATTDKKRSYIMSRIKSKDTSIEVSLRKALWASNIRYRKNYKALPGSPDIAITKHRIAIFCDGDFWHGKNWETKKSDLRNNRDYWIEKIERNIERDSDTDKALLAMGWTVVRFWGSEIDTDVGSCVDDIKGVILDNLMESCDFDTEFEELTHYDIWEDESMDIYERLKELDIELPQAPAAMGLYAPVRIFGNMAYVSGQGPMLDGKALCTGKVGRDVTIDAAQKAAKQVAVNTLALLHEYVGDLNKVKSVVKVLGFVASADGFNEQPAVINGFSQVMIDVFGESGRHARSAVGVSELPAGIPVEIESMFELT